ncbi:hypothetical protein [Microbacterium lacus]|uniref:Lipoprotein n=1 Tax=Microbacterium lacus TaxID=415217 RepID=A0ABN2GIT9_9MICO
MFRRSAAVVVALAVTLGATACQPEPTPTPTGPAFASEDEAFAAAEETYRAYVDALNQVDLSDPETFEAVYAWTTGEANAGARKSFSEMHAEGWTVSGVSAFDGFTPSAFSPSTPTSIVTAEVCLDVSNVDVTDASGQSVVPESRKDRQPAIVTFAAADSATSLAISTSEATESAACS